MHIPRSDMRIFPRGPEKQSKTRKPNTKKNERSRSPKTNQPTTSPPGHREEGKPPDASHQSKKRIQVPEIYKWDSILYLTRHGKTQSPLRTPSARHHHAADCREGQESRNAIVLCSLVSSKVNSSLKGGNHSGTATTKTGCVWIHIADHSSWES